MDLLIKGLFVLILSISSSAYQSRSRLKMKELIQIKDNGNVFTCDQKGQEERDKAGQCVFDKLSYSYGQLLTDLNLKLTSRACCYLNDTFCVDRASIRSGMGCTENDYHGLIRLVEEQYKDYKDNCTIAGIDATQALCGPLMHSVRECDDYNFGGCFEWVKVIGTQPESLDSTTKSDETTIGSHESTRGSDESTTGPDENGDKPGDTRTSTPGGGAQYLCLSVEIVIVFVATLLSF